MKIEKHELDTFRPIDGYVLIEVEELVKEKIDFDSGVSLHITSISADAKTYNSSKKGRIVKVCQKLVPHLGVTNLDKEVNVQEGDTVYFDYTPISEYLRVQKTQEAVNDRHVECEGKIYFVFPYYWLFIRERNGERIALNGIVVGHKVVKPAEGLEIRDTEYPNMLDVVMESTEIMSGSDYEPRIGDRVIHSGKARPIEHEMHDKEFLYFVRPHNVHALA